ncbi:MAG: alpha/beta hydrolase [Candidatus Competibacteraceae bacterium]|nr:alpha/beta hydrolase [Candidatus Competibacteraceae bacterium]
MNASFKIRTNDNLQLQGYTYHSSQSPRVVIVHAHGMGEHASRYEHVANFLSKKDIAWISMDHRGHGLSEGRRGHAPNYEALMNDVLLLHQEAVKTYPNTPIILYGHSMGGNLMLNYLIRMKPEISGAIITSPYLRLAFEPPGWKVALGKFSAGIIPTLTQPTGLDTKALSRDMQVVNDYENDPLVHDKISSAFFTCVHAAGPYAIENASLIQQPVLLMHGTSDQITSHKASEELAINNPQYITLKLWEGLYHEIHNEPEKEQVLNIMSEWILSLRL